MKKMLTFFMLAIGAGGFAQTGDIVVPTGHSGNIQMVIADDQFKYVYTIESQKIIMWNIRTHEQIYNFVLPFEQQGVAVSHDGTMLAYCVKAGLVCYSTVTGKALLVDEQDHGFNSPVFSADDKSIYIDGNGSGLYKIDIAAKSDTQLWQDFSFNYISSNLFLTTDNSLITVTGKGWKIFNETDASKNKTFSFEQQGSYDVDYFRGTNIIAIKNKNVDAQSIYDFYDAASGKKIKTLTLPRSAYNMQVADDGKSFTVEVYDEAARKATAALYSTETFSVTKKIPLSDINYDVRAYSIINNMAFVSKESNVVSVNTASGKEGAAYLQNVTNINLAGVVTGNTSIVNKPTAFMNVGTGASVVTVDLSKMLPSLIEPLTLPSKNDDAYVTVYSPGGDTAGIFFNNKIILKNVKTDKAYGPPLTTTEDILYNQGKGFFCSNDGAYIYFTTFSVKKQNMSVWRLAVKTGIKEKLYERYTMKNVVVNKDKTMLAGIPYGMDEKGYPISDKNIRVWDVKTNKTLFQLDLPKLTENGSPKEQTAVPVGFSDDNKQLVIMRGYKYEWYDVASGKLLSASNGFAPLDADYFSNHHADAVARSYGNGEFALYNTDGSIRFTKMAHAAAISDIIFSDNDSLMYTKGGDETIKVWRTNNGDLLGTLYLFNDGKDYVFVDKDGRFDGNEGGMKQLYYLRNREVISLDKVYEKFYTPNLFQRLLVGEKFPSVDNVIKQAPLVKIQYAEKQRGLEVDDDVPSYNNTTGVAEITVTASTADDAIDEIRLFQNGKVLNLATRNLIVEDDKTKTSTKKYTVNLLPGNNEIRAIALNTQRTESQPDIINVVYNNGTANNTNVTPVVNNKTNVIIDKVDKNATMHLVVVGINAYKNPKMSLNYALADATAFKDEVEKDAKTVITNVQTYFVTDDAADKSGIIKALQQVQQNAKPQDVFVFYYAGHGVVADGNKEFYLVPNDVTDLSHVDEALKEHGIAAKDLQQYAINIQAQKQLFILDACQSAAAFADMLSSDGNQQKNIALVARSTGTHWMAASGAQQFANEFSTLGHGAFTYVLLQALKGEAANDKMITVYGLKDYMQTGVPALMKKYNGSQQTPASYGFGNDFPVEILK